jgi:competence protein ComEA
VAERNEVMTYETMHRVIVAGMPTPAERKALVFLAGVIVLGASVRVVRAARDETQADSASAEALSRQLAAVDSASDAPSARRGRPKRARKGSGRTKPDSTQGVAGNVDSVRATQATATTVVDLDVADQRDIESLPKIGPVLAARIVDDRNTNGPFGSIEGFQRVRGVGPALAAALRPRVTFSGTARQSNAVVDPRLRSLPSQSKSRRRERRN